MKLQLLDWSVIILYFIATLLLGFFCGRKNKSGDSYFLGGRNFPGWAIGVSFIGAMISSVTFMAYPADSFKTAWIRFLPNLAFPLAVYVSLKLFLPFFRRTTISSAYEYLSLRFGASVSLYAAFVFILFQLIRCATVTYLVAVLFASMTELSIESSILLAGGITAVYTVKGGFSAVIWTDVVQTFVIVLGALLCIATIAWAVPGGLFSIITESISAGKMSFMDLNLDSHKLEPIRWGFSFTEKTALMLMLVGFVQSIGGKLNQETIQRWCSAKSTREARKSMVVLGFGALPIWAAFMFLGTCLWVYYQYFPDTVATEVLAGTVKAEVILPHFIITALPRGISGLVISAALAAAMSTLSSSINAGSMVWVHDIQRKFIVKKGSPNADLRLGKITATVLSLVMIGGAFLLNAASTKTLMDFNIVIIALLGGGISGMFLFGMLTRKGDVRCVLIGIIVTFFFSVYAVLIQFEVVPQTFDPYYTAIYTNIIMFGVCVLSAWILPCKQRDLKNLTVWDQSEERAEE